MMDTAELKKNLLELKPELLGVTSMTTTFPVALKTARLAKEILPNAKVILGGVHPTLDPKGSLEQNEVDFVIRGEGEHSLYDELIEEGRIERSNFEYESVHFTKAYEGVCDIPAKRVAEIYKEINEYFYKEAKN